MNRVFVCLVAAACGGEPAAPVAPAEPAPVVAPVAAPVDPPAPADASPPPRGDDSSRRSKNGSASLSLGETQVVVTYGRPEARQRVVWGELVPYGQVWRTGADEATVVHLTGPAKLGDTPVPAGSYALFTIPGPDAFTVVLNAVPKQWGAYEHDPAKDVAKAVVTPEKAAYTDVFTITTDGGALALHWAELRVPVPLTAP